MLKSGKYFIGDPCYVVKDELWDEYCDKSFKTEDGYFEIEGVKVFVSGTMHGDGFYEDTRGKYSFPVDAGIIGATPIDSRIVEDVIREELGVVIEFKEPFNCYKIDREGDIQIGDIIIETDYEDDYDYYEEEEW